MRCIQRTDGMDETDWTISRDATVKDDHRDARSAGLFNGWRQGRRGVRRDDEGAALAVLYEVGNIGNLLVVLAVGDDMVECDAFDGRLSLHDLPADDTPGVVFPGLGHADLIRAVLLVLRGVNHVRVDHLKPGLVAWPRGYDGALSELFFAFLLAEERVRHGALAGRSCVQVFDRAGSASSSAGGGTRKRTSSNSGCRRLSNTRRGGCRRLSNTRRGGRSRSCPAAAGADHRDDRRDHDHSP